MLETTSVGSEISRKGSSKYGKSYNQSTRKILNDFKKKNQQVKLIFADVITSLYSFERECTIPFV